MESEGATTMPLDPLELERQLIRLRAPIARIHVTDTPTDDVLASFVGGCPYLEEGTDWPVCVFCRHPMAFVVQVHARDHGIVLPDALTLLSLFVCARTDECESSCGLSHAEHGENFVVRTFRSPRRELHRAREVPASQPLRESQLLRFERSWNLPDFTTVESRDPFGLMSTWREAGVAAPARRYDELRRKLSGESRLDDAFRRFIGGWPCWTNLSDRTPTCTDGEPLVHVMQIWDSLAGISFYEQASLFHCAIHPSANDFALVYDHT